MPLIAVLVFATLFAVTALIMLAIPSKAARQTEATLAAAVQPARAFREEEIVDVRKVHLLSSIPWVNALLSHLNVAVQLRTILNQADLNWTPGRLMLACLSAWVVTGYLIDLRTQSPGVSALLGLPAGMAPLFYVWNKRRKRLNLFQQKLPEALDVMVSALRAGQSMSGALSAAARETAEPVGRELRLCSEEQNFGIDLRVALDNLLARVPLADVRMMAIALVIHRESGGNLAEVLDKTALVIRQRAQILAQIRVQTAQGRLTGWVLSLLPFVLGFVIYLLNPDYINVLLNRSVGHKLMAIGVGMNMIGLLIIRRIVNIRV